MHSVWRVTSEYDVGIYRFLICSLGGTEKCQLVLTFSSMYGYPQQMQAAPTGVTALYPPMLQHEAFEISLRLQKGPRLRSGLDGP